MSDPLDFTTLGTHGGIGLGAAGLATWLQRFFASREAASVSVQLALLTQKVDNIAESVEKHANMGERLALAEASVKAAHLRIDAIELAGRRRR